MLQVSMGGGVHLSSVEPLARLPPNLNVILVLLQCKIKISQRIDAELQMVLVMPNKPFIEVYKLNMFKFFLLNQSK